MIHGVEPFSTELHPQAFMDVESAHQREVPVVDARPVQWKARRSAQLVLRSDGPGIGVEPAIEGLLIARERGVGSVLDRRALRRAATTVQGLGDRQWLTGLKFRDTRKRPSIQHAVYDEHALQYFPVTADRNLVDIADDEAMRNIVLAHAAVQAQIVVVLRRDGVVRDGPSTSSISLLKV
jgi:hypothetical protein